MLQRIYGTAWANEGGPATPTCTCSRRPRSATTASSAAQLDLFHMQDEAPGHGVLASEGLDDLAAGRAVHARASTATTATRRSSGPQILDRALWEKIGPLGELPREHVHDGVGEARLRGQADELPGPRADLQRRACAATATCRCATASSARATATSRPARCTASCACAASRRTTATSSAPRTRSSRRSAWPSHRRLLQRSTRTSASPTSSIKIATAARQAPRRRRDLGQGRARADARRCARCGVRVASSSPGEGAFYGPKIEYTLKDAIGRAVAVRHDAGRLPRCRSAWAPSTSTEDDSRARSR